MWYIPAQLPFPQLVSYFRKTFEKFPAGDPFAVDVAKLKDVVSPELKNTGDKLVWIHLPVDAHLLPEYEGVMETYRKLHEDMQNGRVKAAYVVDRQGCP